mmetsp:Transcript_12725/g.31248  ORF Transcript_12725/g.31248 Transcript_12725/m.31248 type:complete len:370 (+) Transcript_12725:420-1529(+)
MVHPFVAISPSQLAEQQGYRTTLSCTPLHSFKSKSPLPHCSPAKSCMSIPFMDFISDCRPLMPPICLSIRGSRHLPICCIACCGLRDIWGISPFLPILRCFILDTIFWNRLNSSSSSHTWCGWLPDPMAMRNTRESVIILVVFSVSSSSSFIESMMVMNFLKRACDSCSLPLVIMALIPGIIDMTLPRGPMRITFWNCSYMSRNVKTPCESFWYSSGCLSSPASLIAFISPPTSPMPSSRLTNDRTSKGSKSSKCSPVPIKTMGDSVAATALSAPPPLAWPSSFVMMTLPTLTASLKAAAWSCAACPMELSSTNTTSSGLTAALICCISSNRDASCLCRPDVSTIMISCPSFVNISTPSAAILTGSRSV